MQYIDVRELDMQDIESAKIDWAVLRNKKVLVTGATGMLAMYVVYFLAYLNKKYQYNIHIEILARTKSKVEQSFRGLIDDRNFSVLYQDVCEEIESNIRYDYIFHLAGGANPDVIRNNPVDIIKANTTGLINIMERAKADDAKVLFVSTREVYGQVSPEITQLDEQTVGVLDTLDARSCYPGSKRMAETICKSYSVQHDVRFAITRVAHSYGPGMNIHNDGRIMSDLISDVVNGRNITLKSSGEAVRAFCYITDAVKGLFIALLNGKDNEAYNLANETEEISIRALAELLIKLNAEKNLKLTYKEATQEEKEGYTKFPRVSLNTKKIELIGWTPTINLEEGLKRTVQSFATIG